MRIRLLATSLLLASVATACATDSNDAYLDEAPPAVAESSDGKADGTWQSVETLEGLPGTYVRGAFGLHPLISMRLEGDDREGTYSAWWMQIGLPIFEQGSYSAIPENLAVGFAAITLMPDNRPTTDLDVFAVRRLQRDGGDGLISRLDIQSPVNALLRAVMYRVD